MELARVARGRDELQPIAQVGERLLRMAVLRHAPPHRLRLLREELVRAIDRSHLRRHRDLDASYAHDVRPDGLTPRLALRLRVRMEADDDRDDERYRNHHRGDPERRACAVSEEAGP